MMLQMAMRGQLQGPGVRTKGLFILSLILLLVVCSVGEDKLSSVVAASAAFASPSIPPPPALSVPVWSLASPAIHTDGLSTSMNIVTYCTPVSVAPPKLWAVSLYTNTMTRDAFLNSKVAVLQLMQPDQAGLVPLLGKRSGYEPGFSKKDACQDHVSLNGNSCQWVSGLGIDTDSFIKPTEESSLMQLELLPRCKSYIKLELLKTVEAGDHDVAICQVMGTGTWDDDRKCIIQRPPDDPMIPLDTSTVLYTGELREKGIL